jgi:hypothetical protein
VLKSKNVKYRIIEVVVSFALAVPGTKAAVERIFSVVNSLWNDARTVLLLKM